MTQKKYILVSGIVFGVVSLLHLLRIVIGSDLIIGSWATPSWFSGITFLVTGALSLCAFKVKSD